MKLNRYKANKFGEFMIDVAKMIIGSVLLTGFMNQSIDNTTMFIMGIASTILFLLFGILLINNKEKL